ncbi:hypothetical protein A3J20_03400 [Candidatus Gottesmanbacteria bacterium RIFCSPLOWO2_02_FULL_42_29]|uniref:Teneurin-like YD-shell domain-containing protein n=1 Tax=Candidatus Gottesmanbacteria bacterium RIFCSPLOWO2_01_FULL_42_22 TaxID=1798391 RepID=A0A1F6BEU7_9BACT|nr:MAG: hypothetical protein A2781_04885 [Candidatus Gottesmanbacteria bacterium RIFCSPHIGHO2_01_FULL_42_27]OGG21710.1 MAG: hypothetical protein A3E72_04550 [Candidatus Gottesmanbacteria bacterium RIFCSPHIGHO2_12_FULL_43_26]OGG35047.1 MAG: hypothetical protein A2968_00250 [Candidatus Gottesmanbacteria bacterium RIFCSPLOWO2_01_FULL_42_22]OGG36439.1 MAG: hypothetical protein A3J20_03400 [Candidatus Gottesmanbacteria bacterium RIFCSPLOWO2_02_FULL_42_29]
MPDIHKTWSPKLKVIFLTILILSLISLGAFLIIKKNIFPAKNTLAFRRSLKKFGLIKPSVPGYFKALKTQDLFYDYNSDDVIDGPDYVLLLKEIEKENPRVKGVTSDFDPLAAASDEAGTSNMQLPSSRAFGSDAFNGAATVSYPIDLPPGPAGLTPSLDLSYSSSSVDDLNLGTLTSYRGWTDHPYQNQSGMVGLGWNLGGVQYIARDTKGSSMRALTGQSDDAFILAFSGGSANLSKESEAGTDYGKYSVWRTVPNLKVKVERWSRCKRDAADDGTYFCRYHWLVTTGDGTKHYFGTPTTTTAWQKTYDPDTNEDLENKEYDWYPLYDNDSSPVGPNAWLIWGNNTLGYHSLTYRWYLSKVESIFTVPVEINYSYNLKIEDAGHGDRYVSAVYPSSITYGKNEISFQREARLDYKIHQGDNPSPKRPLRNLERLKKIIVKTLGKVRKVYVLDYSYGWVPAKHLDDGDGKAENDAEVKDGQVIHSLLRIIKVYSDDPDVNPHAKRLPNYTFSYGTDCAEFKGGCPLSSFVWGRNLLDQVKTPSDFFLQTAENGYGGKVTFEYWKDATNNNALNIKYCDTDKVALNGETCKTDNEFNTQRHRISSQIVEDGMGNSVRTNYDYSGNGATLGLGAVKNYSETDEGAEIFNSFSGFEFLGYPEVETTVYEKNSTDKVVAKSKSFYYQALDTATCFKPSPLKGIAYKTINFDVQKPGRRTETSSSSTIRFGPMFGPWEGYYDWNLNDKCATYDPETSISLVIPRDNVSKEFVGDNAVLCTKTFTDHRKIDGTDDVYAQLHTATNYGKVSCSDPNQDDTSDIKKVSYTDYTDADTLKWILPRPKESWTASSPTGTKYNHSQITYNSYGLPTKTSVLINGSAYADTTSAYDATYPWLVTKITDPLGRSSTTTYDNVFHLYPLKVTNNLGQSTTTVYDFNIADSTHPNYGGVLGIPVRVTDANGKVSNSVYDVFGRATETYLPGKNPASSTKADSFNKYYYFNGDDIAPCNDANHCLIGLGKQLNGKGPKMMVYSASRFADNGAAGKVSATHTYYNGLGQTVQTRQLWYENEYSNAGLPVADAFRDIIKSQSFNALGQPEYQSLNYTANPYIPSTQNSFDTRDFAGSANIQKVKYTYDGMGRATTVNYPDGTSETTEYDVGGNPLLTKSSNKNCTDTDPATLCTFNQTTKDAFGQTLEVKEIADSKTYSTSFEYHPILGSVTTTKDTLTNVINIVEFDTLGRKTRMWDADMSPSMSGDVNSWRYEYDKIGNLKTQTNPRGDVSTLSYDSLNRLLSKSVNSTLLLENIYDSCTNGVGKSCQVRSYDLSSGSLLQTVKSQYDHRGRVTSSTLTLSNLPNTAINNQNFSTSFTYDLGGRVKTQTRSGSTSLSIPAETITYTYNRPYLTKLAGTNNYVTNARYNKDGQLIRFSSGNGVNNLFTYNPTNSRLTTLKVIGTALADKDEIKISYLYDPLGNIRKINDDNPMVPAASPFYLTQNFTYDALSRLKDVAGAYTANYSYDDLNNILSKTEGSSTTTLAYSDYNGSFYHRPLTVTDASKTNTYSYDKVGNLASDSERLYTYDKDNRLIKVSPVDSRFKESKFYYDATGARIAKIITGADSTYYINPELEVVINPDTQVGWRQNYFFAGKLAAVRENLSTSYNNDGLTYSGNFFAGYKVTLTAFAKTLKPNIKVDSMIFHVERDRQEIQISDPIPAQELADTPGRYQSSWDYTVPQEPGNYRIFVEIKGSANQQTVLGTQNQPELSLVDLILDFIAKIFFLKPANQPLPETIPTPTVNPAVLTPTAIPQLKFGSFTPVVNLKLSPGEINFTILDFK